MMVYLSNVNSSDSNFSFFPETHKKNHIRNTYAQSRFSEEDIKRIQKEPVEWYGEMGEAMLFDTNIIHRLRRKRTATPRYSLTYYYTPGQCARALEYFEKDLGKDCKKNSIFSNPIWPFKRI
jgi:ectoine hydroxylase-related dioxygenase (phytanoyl-CoA dioxygenase family)